MLKIDHESAASARARKDERLTTGKGGDQDDDEDDPDEDETANVQEDRVVLSEIQVDGTQDQGMKTTPPKTRKRAGDPMGWLAFLLYGPLSLLLFVVFCSLLRLFD